MEHNPIASPSGHLSDGQLNEMVDGPIITRFKQEIYPNMGSPQEEPIEVGLVLACFSFCLLSTNL